MTLHFDGELTAELEQDAYALYRRRNPVVPLALAAGGLALLVLGFSPWRRVSLADQIWFGSVAVLLFLMAFALPQIAWRLAWPGMRQAIGPRMAGTVTADGVKLHTQDEVLPWGGFLAVKADERVVLLYLTRSEALPLHRTLFRSDADWSAFIEAARVGVPSKPRS